MDKLAPIKNNRKNIIMVCGYIFICMFISLLYFKNLQLEKSELILTTSHKNLIYLLYILLSVGISVIIGILIIFIKRSKLEIYKKFFIVAFIIGSLHMCITPFLRGADEYAHFCRIYEIADGNFITKVSENGTIGSELPKSLHKFYEAKKGEYTYSDLSEVIKIPLNKNDTEQYDSVRYITASLYSPIQYFPQALGVFIGKSLNLSVYMVGMLGRFTGFLFWLLICTYSLKIIPAKKIFFVLVLLSPICIGFATALSGDMMLNCMIVLLISKVYNFAYKKKKISKKDGILFLIICSIIALCKIVYIPIVLILFIIPKESFKNNKIRIITLSGIIVISIVFAFLWLNFSSVYLSSEYNNSDAQKQYVLTHPINYGIIMSRTILAYSVVYLTHSSQVNIYPILAVLMWVLVIISLLNNEESIGKHNKNLKDNILFFSIVFLIVCLIETALYIQFTAMVDSVGHFIVDGIQMRYFLPIVLLLPLFFNKKIILIEDKNLVNIFLVLQIPVFITMFIVYL